MGECRACLYAADEGHHTKVRWGHVMTVLRQRCLATFPPSCYEELFQEGWNSTRGGCSKNAVAGNFAPNCAHGLTVRVSRITSIIYYWQIRNEGSRPMLDDSRYAGRRGGRRRTVSMAVFVKMTAWRKIMMKGDSLHNIGRYALKDHVRL